jgi:putative sugar O-methyltransferase
VWLEKYPIDNIGNPVVYQTGDFRFNKRWSNNIRYLSLVSQNLAPVLEKDASSIVDIGGGYGIYLYLLKHEFPNCNLSLVEFPEQLLLAYYFLKSNFPDARINKLEDVYGASTLNRQFIDKFDFLLIPIECYPKLEADTFDLISNFYSLGEMSNEWFDTYRDSEAFKSAPYLFTVNRVYSRPTYNTDIDILRYRLHEYETMHFEPSRYERDYIQSIAKFFYRRAMYSSQFFEFIGRTK